MTYSAAAGHIFAAYIDESSSSDPFNLELKVNMWEPGTDQALQIADYTIEDRLNMEKEDTQFDGARMADIVRVVPDATGTNLLIVVADRKYFSSSDKTIWYLYILNALNEDITEISLSEEEGTTLFVDKSPFQFVQWSPDDNYFCMPQDGNINIYSGSGNLLTSIAYDETWGDVKGFLFSKDEKNLFVLFGSEILRMARYHITDGELDWVDVIDGNIFFNNAWLTNPLVQINDDQLLLFNMSTVSLIMVGDEIHGKYAECHADEYDSTNNSLINSYMDNSGNNWIIGEFPVYADSELLERGKQLVEAK